MNTEGLLNGSISLQLTVNHRKFHFKSGFLAFVRTLASQLTAKAFQRLKSQRDRRAEQVTEKEIKLLSPHFHIFSHKCWSRKGLWEMWPPTAVLAAGFGLLGTEQHFNVTAPLSHDTRLIWTGLRHCCRMYFSLFSLTSQSLLSLCRNSLTGSDSRVNTGRTTASLLR